MFGESIWRLLFVFWVFVFVMWVLLVVYVVGGVLDSLFAYALFV